MSRQRRTSRFHDLPSTIARINEFASESLSAKHKQILPRYLETFRYHLSTDKIPSLTDTDADLLTVRACLVAFTNGLLFLEILEKGENIQHPGIWEGVISMWKPVYSWALYFFQSHNILSGNASAVQEEDVASVTMLLAQMSAHADISRVIISNAVFLETVCRLWLFLGRSCEHPAYPAFRKLMHGLLSGAQKDPLLSRTLRPVLIRNPEQVSKVVLRSLITEIQRQPTNFEYLMHALTSFPAFSEASDDVHNDLYAHSAPWLCRAIRLVVSRREPYSPFDIADAIHCLDIGFEAVYGCCWSFIYTSVTACDHQLLESILKVDRFVRINQIEPGKAKFYDTIIDVLTLAMVNTVYRSFLRRVRWAMAHAIKLEPDLDMDGPIAKHWFRLKEVATEHEIAKQRYDIEHDKGLRLCNNNKCPKTSREPSRRCSGCWVSFYCSEQCQRLHWVGDHRKICKDIQKSRKMGGTHDTCARDRHLQGEWTKIKVRQNLRHLVTMRKADILKNPAAENYPTAITVNFCHEDGVRISCIAKDEARDIMGQDDWDMYTRDGDKVLILMEVPYGRIFQLRTVYPLRACGIPQRTD